MTEILLRSVLFLADFFECLYTRSRADATQSEVGGCERALPLSLSLRVGQNKRRCRFSWPGGRDERKELFFFCLYNEYKRAESQEFHSGRTDRYAHGRESEEESEKGRKMKGGALREFEF